jgi:hypothetical protein
MYQWVENTTGSMSMWNISLNQYRSNEVSSQHVTLKRDEDLRALMMPYICIVLEPQSVKNSRARPENIFPVRQIQKVKIE